MEKIQILSPIHIGTGEQIEVPCFHESGKFNTLDRYSFMDIIQQMPVDVITDSEFLNSLSRSSSNKKYLYSIIHKHVNYSFLKPLYSVRYDGDPKLNKDVDEQIKTSGKPYIPGSSIKGALLEAWFYYEIKHNYSEDIIDRILSSKKVDDYCLLDYLGCTDRNSSQFMKDLQSCLICHDIFFKDIELYDAVRVGSTKGKDVPLGTRECIRADQSVVDQLFEIDIEKIRMLITRYSPDNSMINNYYMKLITDFSSNTIYRACNEYLLDVLQTERSNECIEMYRDFDCEKIIHYNDSLYKNIKSSMNTDQKCFYLRIGNGTSYYNKSVSLIIKQKSPDLFEKYFDSSLSPNPFGKRQKPSAKKIPSTRTILENDNEVLPAGYMKVMYD